ncbi:MAG: N-acetylmuramoyl-L-alanine amidase [Chitinophagaceae bacterium]|nr:N-acetylmuramoyl-L-alanine amidase [Chitinophagaceae bacterium]
MIAAAEYLLKVMLCSAVFTGYYWLALRNKIFHQWNRFYLLGAVFLSLLIPVLNFTILQPPQEKPAVAYQLIESITTEEKWFEEQPVLTVQKSSFFTAETLVAAGYTIVCCIFWVMLLMALLTVFKLLRRNPHWKLNGLVFVDTEAKGAPFSFLHYIFWNRNIDFESAQGQQIFTHELVHVTEKHSWDKLFINIVLVFFWMNPFFRLVKKELTLIHEFIADKKSVANGDTSAFASMIMAAAFPGQTLSLTNPFFYSPIKRRLLMLSKLNNPKVGYISRLLLLPVLVILFFAFVLKTKETKIDAAKNKLEKEFTVVIDAGHGLKDGKNDGAKSEDGFSEDEYALALAKAIVENNKNEKLKIILTRADENFIDLRKRSEFVSAQNPDIFIALHANFAPKMKEGNTFIDNPANGVEAYVSRKNPTYNEQSSMLGNFLLKEVSQVINPNRGIKTREKGIWVIDQSSCPTVLLQCGFLSNKKDLELMKNNQKQQEIAAAILKGIENYLLANEKGTAIFSNPNSVIQDTTPFAGGKFELHDTNKKNHTYFRFNNY